MAVGSPLSGNSSGNVKTYRFITSQGSINNSWIESGNINGTSGEFFGDSVYLNKPGSVLAAGGYGSILGSQINEKFRIIPLKD